MGEYKLASKRNLNQAVGLLKKLLVVDMKSKRLYAIVNTSEPDWQLCLLVVEHVVYNYLILTIQLELSG